MIFTCQEYDTFINIVISLQLYCLEMKREFVENTSGAANLSGLDDLKLKLNLLKLHVFCDRALEGHRTSGDKFM